MYHQAQDSILISYHTAVLAGSRIIIFGGKGKNAVFRDVHALDPLTMTFY